MLRDIQYPAIVLRIHTWEKHKFVTLLTPEGLIEAKQFGGLAGKSVGVELRPFVEGQFFLYKKGQYWTVKGVDQVLEHEALRENLSLIYTATFFCELIYRSHALGGEHLAALDLLHKGLDLLERKPREKVVIYILWELLQVLGFAWDMERCAKCGHILAATPACPVLYLDYELPGFVCCGSSSVMIPEEGCAFLQSFLPGRPRVAPSDVAVRRTKDALLSLVQILWDERLRSLQGGFV